MHRIFQTFVDSLESSHDAASLRTALVDVAVAFELPLVAYFVGPAVPTCDPTLISNYPTEWTDRYLRNQYDRLDPVIHQLAHSAEPFSWSSEARSSHGTDAQHRFLDEARTFGIGAGLTARFQTRPPDLPPSLSPPTGWPHRCSVPRTPMGRFCNSWQSVSTGKQSASRAPVPRSMVFD